MPITNYLIKLLEPTTNGPEVAQVLSELLYVKISATTLKKEIEEHPDYPSLLSISDVLNTYGIENMGIKFDPNKLTEMPCPFITQLNGIKSGSIFFTIVRSTDNGSVAFFDPEEHQWRTISKDDFLKRCSDVALLVEVADSAGEKDYTEKRKEEKRKKITQYFTFGSLPVLVIIAGTFALLQGGVGVLLPFIYLILMLAGSLVGILLLWYELDQHNPVLKQICSAGKKVNCGAVLQSKAYKIAGISWSAIGFSYFMGNLLVLLFLGITNPIALFAAAWLNALAVPYTIFSVYYQWRVAKQWCILCLCVQGLLLLQLAICLTGNWHTLLSLRSINIQLIIQTLVAFAVPFIAVLVLLPVLQKAKESKRNFTELQKLKHNQQIFEALLQKQKQLAIIPHGLGITLGSSDATYRLIKVCNPYCGPCAEAHKPMEDLLHNNPDLQIQILFIATNNEEDIRTPPVKHLLAIAEKYDEDVIKRALDDWYSAEMKDYEIFAAKYPLNEELQQQISKIETMKIWSDEIKIDFTPTFFVSIQNSKGQQSQYYQLPEIYNVADLKYFFAV